MYKKFLSLCQLLYANHKEFYRGINASGPSPIDYIFQGLKGKKFFILFQPREMVNTQPKHSMCVFDADWWMQHWCFLAGWSVHEYRPLLHRHLAFLQFRRNFLLMCGLDWARWKTGRDVIKSVMVIIYKSL